MKKRILIFVLFALFLLVISGCSKHVVEDNSKQSTSDELNIGVNVIDSETADLEITDLDVNETEFENLDI